MGPHLPKEATIQTLRKVVTGWYTAGADSEAKTNSDASERAGLRKETISRQNNFLTTLGILEKEGQQKVLTDEGIEYAESIYHGDDSPETAISDLIYDFELTQKIVDYIKINQPGREETIQQVRSIIDQESTSDGSVDAFLDMLSHAGIINEENDTLSALTVEEYNQTSDEGQGSVESTEDESVQEQNKSTITEPQQADRHNDGINRIDQGISNIQINVEVEITGGDDPENVKNIFLGLKEALNTDVPTNPSYSDDEEEANQNKLNEF